MTIEFLSRPYFFINSLGVPDSLKVSLVPTNSWGAGWFRVRVLEILSPKPPKILCSSADTKQPVFETEFKIISSSKGFIVWILIISALIPFSFNSTEASRASHTKCPVATILTSVPSFNNKPLPISKPFFILV